MMTVNFIAMGKLKESYFREACAEYQKRLSSFAKVTVKGSEPRADRQGAGARGGADTHADKGRL